MIDYNYLYGNTISTSFRVETQGFTSGAQEMLPAMARLSRADDDSIMVEVGPYPRATIKLGYEEVRKLAGKLVAALDDWPQRG